MKLDPALLAEKLQILERHLARVKACLPARVGDLKPGSDGADAVILHMLQALQVSLDLAMSACVRLNLGTPSSYSDAFERLAASGYLSDPLAERLARAAGFRNLIVHAYEQLDLKRVHAAAKHGPKDLRALFAALRDA